MQEWETNYYTENPIFLERKLMKKRKRNINYLIKVKQQQYEKLNN